MPKAGDRGKGPKVKEDEGNSAAEVAHESSTRSAARSPGTGPSSSRPPLSPRTVQKDEELHRCESGRPVKPDKVIMKPFCKICLDEDNVVDTVLILCGHIFCEGCVNGCMDTYMNSKQMTLRSEDDHEGGFPCAICGQLAENLL